VSLHLVFSSFYHLAFCKNSVPPLLIQCYVSSNEICALTVPFPFSGVILIFVLFLFPLLCYADIGDALICTVAHNVTMYQYHLQVSGLFLHVFLGPSEWSSQPGGHGLRLQQV
jgi:hypothetical protein